jgi:enoyl-[acyl-carrier protein] reductase III
VWLESRRVLITGGSRGLGRALALRLATHRPAHIAIGYVLDHDAAHRTVRELLSLGVQASCHAADVGDEGAMAEMFRAVAQVCGTLDVFVSNAARGSFRPLLEMSVRSWQRVMELNAQAFLLGAQKAAELMPNGGRILAVSSLGAHFYTPGYGALGASKAALETLARYLAVELAPRGINVNVVCGGLIDTDSTRQLPDFERTAEAIVARTPAGRLGQPEDLAAILAFLCTSDSDWIRGQTIVADGGFSLGG